MLVLPTHAVAVVSKRSVAGVPVRDEAAVGAERPEVHDRNRSDGVEARGVDGLVQAGVNARFGPCVGEPTLRVGVVRTRQRAFRPVGSVEHGGVGELGIGPTSRHLFVVGQEQLPTVDWQGGFLNAAAVSDAPRYVEVVGDAEGAVKDDPCAIGRTNQQVVLVVHRDVFVISAGCQNDFVVGSGVAQCLGKGGFRTRPGAVPVVRALGSINVNRRAGWPAYAAACGVEVRR